MSRTSSVGSELLSLLDDLGHVATKGVDHESPVNAAPADFLYYKAQIERDEQELRREFAKNIIDRINTLYGNNPLKVFLSYSNPAHGQVARTIFENEKLDVLTGFDDAVKFGDDLAKDIIDVISSCDYFLGIWSPAFTVFDVKSIQASGRRLVGQQGSGPSIWMPFELGVARAFGKPFKLLVPSDIHDDILARTNPNQVAIRFGSEDDLSREVRSCASSWRKQGRRVLRD
jgi:hypothetical protein